MYPVISLYALLLFLIFLCLFSDQVCGLAGFPCLVKAYECLLLLNVVFWSCCVICVLALPLPEHGFVGYSSWLLGSNSLPDYSPGENFFTVFGVFFPAATGELHPDAHLSSTTVTINALKDFLSCKCCFLFVAFRKCCYSVKI